MSAISGEVTDYLAMLGKPKDDERVLRLLGSSSHFREQEAFDDPGRGGVWVTIASPADGIELQFKDDALDRAVICAQDEAHRDAFPRPTAFIEGVDLATATRDELNAVLGEPFTSSSKYTKHKVGQHYLHTTFRNERVARIVVMSTAR